MKRRSFLQAVGGAVAAVFVPAVAKSADTVNAVFHGEPLASEAASVGRSIWVSSTTARFGYGHGTFNYPFATIQEAMNVANSNDVIVLKPGHRVNMEHPVEIKDGVVITGPHDERARINFS